MKHGIEVVGVLFILRDTHIVVSLVSKLNGRLHIGGVDRRRGSHVVYCEDKATSLTRGSGCCHDEQVRQATETVYTAMKSVTQPISAKFA